MAYIEENKVTEMSGFPYLLLEMNKLDAIPTSLRLIISGGDVLRSKYVTRLLDKALVYNTYGPSETTVCASYYRCNDGYTLDDGTYPIGKPVLGVEMMVMDETDSLCHRARRAKSISTAMASLKGIWATSPSRSTLSSTMTAGVFTKAATWVTCCPTAM